MITTMIASFCPEKLSGKLAHPRHIPVSVKQQLLLCKPRPCNLSTETALQPLIWYFEGQIAHFSSYPEECFFPQTPV